VNPVLIHTQAPVGFLKGSIRDANASSKNFIDDRYPSIMAMKVLHHHLEVFNPT
jgi:hypothetical protein